MAIGREKEGCGGRAAKPQGAPHIRAIIFDIDGVLADSRAAVVHNTKQLMREFGYSSLDSEIEAMSSAHSAETVLIALAPGLERAPGKMAGMLSRLSAITTENMGLVKPTLLVEKLPALAAGFRLAAATNRKRSALLVLRKFKIEEFFSAVMTTVDCKPKPDPDMLLKAARKMGVKPFEAVFVGDNKEDERAAFAAGMRFIMVDAAKGDAGCGKFLAEFCQKPVS